MNAWTPEEQAHWRRISWNFLRTKKPHPSVIECIVVQLSIRLSDGTEVVMEEKMWM